MHTQASAYPPTQEFATGQEEIQPGSTGQEFTVTGAYKCPPEPDNVDFEFPQSDTELSDDQPESDEGELSSDNLEKPELTEDDITGNSQIHQIIYGLESYSTF